MKVMVLALLLFSAAPLASQSSCPAETSGAREIVNRLNSGAEYSEVRQRRSLPAVASSDLHLLTDATHAAACNRLYQVLDSASNDPNWRTRMRPTFFQAGGRYYVALVRATSSETPRTGQVHIQIGWSPVFVIDSEFNIQAGVAM